MAKGQKPIEGSAIANPNTHEHSQTNATPTKGLFLRQTPSKTRSPKPPGGGVETDLPRIAPPGLTTGRPQNHSRQTRAAISREAVKQAEQLAEELTGDGFSEQVSDHTRAGQMLNHNRLAGNKVTKILESRMTRVEYRISGQEGSTTTL